MNIIQLNNYVKPEIQEVKNKEWVLNGVNNSYFDYVKERYIGSPTNAAIIDTYKALTFGKGLSARDASKKPNQWAKLLSLISKKDLRKIIDEYTLQGNAAVQVIASNGGTPAQVKYLPINTVAPQKANEDGEIEGYWYCTSWKDYRKAEFEPVFYPKWTPKTTEKETILYINSAESEVEYFSLPPYQSGLQYAEMEEEISNYYINHIKNGFSFGYVVNMNNGKPADDDQAREIERKIRNGLTGSSNAGKMVISFNEGKEAEITIVPLVQNASHKQWETINKESEEKLMRAHRVVSPMLFGIKNQTGLGNNADELDTALKLTMDMKINPVQYFILDFIDPILQAAGVNLDLYFKPINEEEQQQEERKNGKEVVKKLDPSIDIQEEEDLLAKETSYNGAQISSALQIVQNVKSGLLTKDQGFEFLVNMLRLDEFVARKLVLNIQDEPNPSAILIETGEDEPDPNEWILISGESIEGTPVDINLAALPSNPNTKSEQDNDLFKVRYVYAGNPKAERAFCKDMISAKKVYRKEDIDAAENKVIQAGMGPNGTDTYSIWLYKGGVNCKHFFERRIYLRRNNKKITVNEARRRILELDPSDRKEVRLPKNDPLVAQAASPSNNNFKLK